MASTTTYECDMCGKPVTRTQLDSIHGSYKSYGSGIAGGYNPKLAELCPACYGECIRFIQTKANRSESVPCKKRSFWSRFWPRLA